MGKQPSFAPSPRGYGGQAVKLLKVLKSTIEIYFTCHSLPSCLGLKGRKVMAVNHRSAALLRFQQLLGMIARVNFRDNTLDFAGLVNDKCGA